MSRITVSRALRPSLSLLEDKDEKQIYTKQLNSLLEWTKKDGLFPCSNPVSVCRSSVLCLAEERLDSPHLATLKSDGVRYILFLTMRRAKGSGPVALMIDRCGTMFEVETVGEENVYTDDTILEGELVWEQPNQDKMLFLLFDALRVDGETILSLPFSERYKKVHKLTSASEDIAELPRSDMEERVLETRCISLVQYSPPVRMRPKVFVSVEHIPRLWKDRKEAGHHVDGIILQDPNRPYHPGTCRDGSILKWKEHSTVDLKLGEGNTLLCGNGEVLPSILHSLPVERKLSRIDTPPSSSPSAFQGRVVEFFVEVKNKRVVFFGIRSRPDKDRANTLSVVLATLKDILDPITPDEMSSMLCRTKPSTPPHTEGQEQSI